MAMAKSKEDPSLRIWAGARLTTILFIGNSNPPFLIADRTLSFASFTEVAGNPTMSKLGRPGLISTSTVTTYPSIPLTHTP